MYTGDNDHNYYSAEQDIMINDEYINNIAWQQHIQPQYTDCNLHLPPTWNSMNNEEKSDQQNWNILKTALTHGSAAALKKTYQDFSAHVMVPNNNQCPINSTTSNQFLQNWNNTYAEKDSLSSLPQKSMTSTTYNQFYNNDPQWKPFKTEAFSSLESNNPQLTVFPTYNNISPFSSYCNDIYTRRVQSIDSSSHMMPYESSEKYRQQNVQNNYGQNQEFNNYKNNNTCMNPMTNPAMQYHQSMQRNIHLMEQKSKRGRKKKKLTYTGNILGQEKRTRQTYTTEQTLILEQAFQTNEYVSLKMRIALAHKTNLSGNQIKTWFQNRRMKEKKNRENNLARIPETNTAPIHDIQASTLSDQKAQPQLQPYIQHNEGYHQNYTCNPQQPQQNDIINQSSCFSNSASNKVNHANVIRSHAESEENVRS